MQSRTKQISRVTWLGMAINAMLSVFKLFAGICGRSSAMLADAVHSLSDFISDIVILIFLKISCRGRDENHKFGHGKFETMATFILSIILIIVAAEILRDGIQSVRAVLRGEPMERPAAIALIAATVSIVCKEFCYQITAFVGRRVQSPAVMANAWHHRSDAWSSVGSLLGIGGAMWLGNQWVMLDPIMGCCISVVIFVVSLRMALPAMKELLDIALPEETERHILFIASSVPGVSNVHNLKTRRNGPSVIIDAHVMVHHSLTIVEAHEVATEVERRLTEKFGRETQINIHVEPDNFSHENHE